MTTFNFISNKKHFRVLPLLLLFLTLGVGNTWGALTEYYTYTFGSKQFEDNTTAKTLGSITWTPATSWRSGSGYWGYDGTKGQQWGSSSNGLNTLTLTAGSSISNIKKITINASIASGGSCTLSVKVGSTTIGNDKTLTTTATSYDFESATGLTGTVQIKLLNNSVNKAQYIKSITIYTDGGGSPTLSSIAVKTAPTKTTYTEGETFDPTGLEITRTYSDASTSDYTYAGHTGDFTFSPTTSTALTTSNTSVTITYGGKSTSQAITVTAGGGGGGSGGSCDAFSETWNSCDGTGGNTGGWSGSVASGSIGDLSDNSGWTYSTGYKGDKCIRTNKGGHVTTPSISVTNGSTYTLSYKAADWGTDGCSFAITATGATVTAGSSSGALSQGSWGDYSATLTATASTMQITFTASSGARGWLDEICVSGNGPIKVTASLTEFTYVLNNGPSAYQSFKVQGTDLAGNLTITAPTNYQISTNGSTWNTSITLNKDAGDDVDETTIYVRLISGLAKGEYDGNITFSDGTNDKTLAVEGSVTLACTDPSISFASTTVDKYRGDSDFKIDPTISGNTLGATVSWSSNKESCATVGTDGTVHIIKATGEGAYVRITATLEATETADACQSEQSAYYDIYIKNRITWLVNGAPYTVGTPTTEVTEGAKITTAPTDPNGSTMCGGKVFVGWTTSAVAIEQSSAPDPLYTSTSVKDENIENNVTFHAVFADEIVSLTSSTYDLVRNPSEFVSGEDYVIAAYSSGDDYALKAAMSGSYNLASQSITIPSSNKFTCETASLIWQVTKKAENQYTLYNADAGKYAYMYTSGSYKNLGLQDGEYIWNLQYDKEEGYSPTYYFEAGDISGYYFYYNSSAYKTTSTKPTNIYFYKKTTEYTYDNYSTTCGPTIKANEVERLTSSEDQTVKSQAITVRGSSLSPATGTLSANITGTDKDFFSCTLASTAISEGAINTTFVISYTPNDNHNNGALHTAQITFSDGTTTSDPITLRGRSLPEHFAIVAYDGANYYALDGSMTGEMDRVPPFPVTVTAGAVDLCPSQAVYTLTDRDPQDEKVHLVGPAGRLWGSSSKTSLNTKSLTSTSQTGWLLSTSDFNTYHITNADVTDRGIIYYESSTAFGHYKTSNYGATHYFGDLMLLPITQVCTCLPKPLPTVLAKSISAIITWPAVAGADHYEVTCTGGSVLVDNANLKATISGLSNSTNYTFTIKAVASGIDCSLIHSGNFTTTYCDDVPYSISVAPALHSATFRWTMEAATATIRIYSDEDCNTQVGSDHTGLTSPATIDGLAENTTYYAKIFADGICESPKQQFQTNSPSVELVEWFPDSIRIVIDAGSDASVIIEDKADNGSATSSYAEDVFFSKYFEASGSTKLVGLYNGTDHDIDISDLVIVAGAGTWVSTKGVNNYVAVSDVSKLKTKYGDGSHIYLPRGTEIIFYSIETSDRSGFEGAGGGDCITKYYSWDDLENDAVENWYRIGKSSNGTDDDGHKPLNFSGRHSVGLFRSGSLIDVIGAGTNTTAVEATTQISGPRTLGNGRNITTPNDAPGFYVVDGWSPRPQEGDDDYTTYPDGYSTFLTTNRCLLIRANHVVNGDSAVLNNQTQFKTLGEYTGVDSKTHKAEWVGIPIGNDGTFADRSCLSGQQFGYVGQYDYNAYYATFDSIAELKELDGKRNPDGTYTVSIPHLDTLSCTQLKVKVYEGGAEKATKEYQVPIMVDDTVAWTTNDTIFHNSKHDAAACAECDVVILKGATLTKTNAGANDVTTIRNLTIYSGGTMVVPNTRTFNVSSVQFRVEGERAPQAKLQGDLITSDQQVIVTRRINNDRYYFFSLPYDCNVSDIRWSNGEIPVRGTEYQILEYDAERRAAEGSTKGAPGHWKPAGSTLHAGVGYNVAVNSKYLKELIFPMAIGQTNLTDKEDNKTTNKVTLAKNVGPTSKNNHNWNLVAHPYVSPFNAYSDAKITAGYLEVEFINDGLDTIWHRKETSNVYLTMPSFAADKITYTQTLSAGTLDPFLAVFVQAASEGDLTFDQSNRKLSAPSRRWAAKAENEDQSIFVGVTLSGNGQSDQTNLRIRPDFTNEYQLGYDLQKFTTYYTTRPQIYMKPADLQLAFQAVNDDVAKTSFIPVGVYCYKAGTYTFALSEDYPIDEVEAVYLHDATTGETTNLLYDTYTITTDKQLYTNARFSLNVIVNRRAPQVTTDIDVTNAPDNLVRKILINGHVYIQRGAELYDVTGKQMSNL